MMAFYPTFKALHIISVVCWFAGLFYIVRLFVYLTECSERAEPDRTILLEQMRPMAYRLWFGITWPSCIATLFFGFSMVHVHWQAPWMKAKLVAVAGLFLYHLICHWIHRELQAGRPPWKARSLRIWNEVSTLFLVGIVFLVVLKSTFSFLYGAAGLAVFAAILMVGITVYRRRRMRMGGP